MKNEMLKFASYDETNINEWVFNLFKIQHDGCFGNILIGQYKDPSTAFRIVYEDIGDYNLPPERVSHIRKSLEQALIKASDRYSKEESQDNYILLEFTFTLNRYGLTRPL